MSLTSEDIIIQMYSGEEKRDASSKVRGFLFQDLIAIEELLRDDTDYICNEYIEDVFIKKQDTLKIVQAKYYPKTNANLKEIFRDLYYQYLRLEIYGYEETVRLQLSIHSKNTYSLPVYADILLYLGLTEIKTEKPVNNFDRLEEIYQKKKIDAQAALFQEFAYKESVENFLKCLNIEDKYKGIGEYREELSLELDKIIVNSSGISDEDIRKKIAVGLSIRYIEEKYDDSCEGISTFESKRCFHTDFIHYLKSNTMEISEQNIVAYLQSIIFELWSDILESNENLSIEKVQLMNKIVRSTSEWITSLCSGIEGQYKLINTISRKKSTYTEGFYQKSINERIRIFNEQREAFEGYLKFFWKIVYCINYTTYMSKDSFLIDVRSYIDDSQQSILGVNFLDVESKAILFSGTDGNSHKTCIKHVFERMKILRPEVWYWKGPYLGNYFYEHSVSEIYDGKTVSSLSPNTFRLECMKCITVDEDEWKCIDDCKHTIFCDKCVGEN